ncbi:MAG: hypothetical protein IJW18_03285 [Lachnospiraceae bacterium]|nr:hypothetical protein [Lachnospiraceae bacterium]
MKEQLYTIPVNDAFDEDTECAVCAMYRSLEKASVEYTMGPSYMEDDIRMETDRIGFCKNHMKQLWDENNRLGLALVLQSHMQKTTRDIKKMANSPFKGKSLFRKSEDSPLISYVNKLNNSCFVCDRVQGFFERYIITIFYLWQNDKNFQKKYLGSKGFCTEHYGLLLKEAPRNLMGDDLDEFMRGTSRIYVENMERMIEDVDWFVNKFDYRYKDEPWKNSRDAVPRAMTKVNGIIPEEDKKK